MKKVFHFDAPREKYLRDAAIAWCFDNRFEMGSHKFLKRIGVTHSDPMKIAGGASASNDSRARVKIFSSLRSAEIDVQWFPLFAAQ